MRGRARNLFEIATVWKMIVLISNHNMKNITKAKKKSEN
jgi:hypothetical protein